MTTYTEGTARCFVFTFKEGLLSPMAHDLRIEVRRFSLVVDDVSSTVSASFDTASLRVDTPMKDGRENPSALGDADKAAIAERLREDVLECRKFPDVRFASRRVERRADGGYDLEGDLTLHGVTRPLTARTMPNENGQELELTLHQPDFGIRPYTAMLGTLKIKPDVKVRIVTGSDQRGTIS